MTARPLPCQPAPFDFAELMLAGGGHGSHVVGMPGKDKAREERLAAALRENLRRRKAQARDLQARTEEPTRLRPEG